MGKKKNNHQRRADKANARARAHQRAQTTAGRPGRTGPSAGTAPPSLTDKIVTAAYALRGDEPRRAEQLLRELADRPAQDVAVATAGLLEGVVAGVWDHGWQPADLERFVLRQLGSPHADVIGAVWRPNGSTGA